MHEKELRFDRQGYLNYSDQEVEHKQNIYRTNIYREARANCNLCNKAFHSNNRFERFCQKCKEEDDLYLNA
jgi:hypothetical protein